MGDDKAVISVVMVFDGLGHEKPLFRLHVGAIDVQQLHRVYGAERGRFRHALVQFLRSDAWRQPLRCFGGSDGAAGGNEKDFLHVAAPFV